MLYLVRHANAEKRICGLDHPQRHLTAKGLQQSQQLAAWFCLQRPSPHVIFASPFTRCMETAQPIAAALNVPLTTAIWLSHGAELALCLEQIHRLAKHQTTLLVGHEPELSHMLSALLNETHADLTFTKAGIACLSPSEQGWNLMWKFKYKELAIKSDF